MIAAASTSFQSAVTGYEGRMADLVLRCPCPDCRIQSRPDDNVHRFCRPTLLETIMSVALALSETTVFPGLHLKRGGVLETYHSQLQRRGQWAKVRRRNPSERNWPLQEKSSEQDWHCEQLGVFGLVTCSLSHGMDAKLNRCFSLFTASDRRIGESIAASQNGICCYLGILEDGLSDDPDECLVVHIMPGSIEHDNKPFDHITSDEEQSENMVLGNASPSSLLQRVTSYTKMEMSLAESLRGLQIHFRVGPDQDQSLQWVRVQPSLFLEAVIRAKGWTQCSKNDCQQLCEVPEGSIVVCKLGRKDIQVIEGDKLVRSAALVLAELERSVYLTRKTECVQCCIRSGTQGYISEYYGGDPNAVEDRAYMKLVVISRPSGHRMLPS
jgi:SH3-like domain-containing protein